MTEEVKNEGIENQTEGLENKEVTVDPIEEKARELGWNPDKFDKDDPEFIDAKEFVRRKPLFDKIEVQKRELKDVQKALKALQSHHSQVQAAEYKRAMEDLKAEKKVALNEGDADKLIEIDEQIADIKAQEVATAAENKRDASKPHPEFISWVNENKWYQTNEELRGVADEVGMAHSKLHPEKSPGEVLEYVVKRVKKLYPEEFTNPNKAKPSSVEGNTTSTPSRSTKPAEEFELDDDERKVMNTLVREKVMTKEEYIAGIKSIRGVK